MTKRLLTIFVFLGLSGLGINAQTDLPNECEAGLPKLLEPDLLRDQDIKSFLNSSNWGQDNKTHRYWKVYSDRANNVTYTSPSDNSERFAILDFNDELHIAKIQNGYALVYSEYYTSCVFPRISVIAKSRGWVPMDHLLLWSSCPADEKGIYHKALPFVNVDEYMRAKASGTEKDMGKVFDNPMARSNSRKLRVSVKVYFVMKEDKESGMVLLSKRNILTGKSSQVLYGWVDKASYIPWDQRLCLEPNWREEVAEKFVGRKVPVYFDKNLSEQCASMPLGRANNLGQEITKYRMYPDEMRLIVLGNGSIHDDIYKVIAYETPGNKDGYIGLMGYTPKKDMITGYDYWKPVIYISNPEYNDLIGKLHPVMAAAEEGSEDRRPYVDAMKELIRTLYGNIEEKEMMSMDTRKVMDLVAGLNVRSESLKGRTLKQIQDNHVVSQEEFGTMLSNLQDKFKKLDRIKNGYKYAIKIEEETWYWIPVDDLP